MTSLRICLIALCLFICLPPAHAWNRAGHLVSGAIAYDSLKTADPTRLAALLKLLESHPAYPVWKNTAQDYPFVEPGKAVFMQAATFADDARRREFKSFDRPDWHYVNYAYTPGKALADVKNTAPFNGKLIDKLNENLAQLRNGSLPDAERANALCWVLHLTGDLHQPLHVTALVNADFPQGDRGGNDVYVRGSERANKPINLHRIWDDGVAGNNTNLGQAATLATAIRTRLSSSNGGMTTSQNLNSGSETQQIQSWVAQSYTLAVQAAYLNGNLKYVLGDTDGESAPVLPDGYTQRLKEVSEVQITLAGQRMAGLLAGTNQ